MRGFLGNPRRVLIVVHDLVVTALAMLAVTALIAVTVYEWLGLAVLRRAWINLDLIWSLALATAGVGLLLA